MQITLYAEPHAARASEVPGDNLRSLTRPCEDLPTGTLFRPMYSGYDNTVNSNYWTIYLEPRP